MPGMLSYVPIDAVVVKPQVRETIDEAALAVLAESIRQHGVLVPLLAHSEDGDIVLDDGHRRLAAARLAGCLDVPMVIGDHVPTPAGRTTLQLLANAHRADLKVTEKGRAIQQLMQDTGWSAAEVSAKLGGPSPASISKLLALLVLPRTVQALVDAGKLPMSSAYAIATVADASQRERLVEQALGGALKRDGLIREVARIKRGRPAPRARRAPGRRERVVIPFGDGNSLTLLAPALTVEEVSAWLAKIAARLRGVAGADGTLADAAKRAFKPAQEAERSSAE